MKPEDHEHFGVPAENVGAARKWADKQRKRQQYHTEVPSRKQVKTLPPDQLARLLIGWMVYSPIEIVPSRVQIAQVVEIMMERDDRAALASVLTMCKNYIEGN